jgi:hypothetical protein
MRGRENTSLQDRLSAAANAKKALLERAKANNPANDPGFAERQKIRLEAAAAREAREAERREAKRLEQEREEAARVVAEAARLEAEKLDAERRALEAVEAEARAAALLIEQKAARDARYAARKSRQGQKR